MVDRLGVEVADLQDLQDLHGKLTRIIQAANGCAAG